MNIKDLVDKSFEGLVEEIKYGSPIIEGDQLVLDVWIKPVKPVQYVTIDLGPLTEEMVAILKEVVDEFNAESDRLREEEINS